MFNNGITFYYIKRSAMGKDSTKTFTFPWPINIIYCVQNSSILSKVTSDVVSVPGVQSYTKTTITLVQDTYADAGGWIFIIGN